MSIFDAFKKKKEVPREEKPAKAKAVKETVKVAPKLKEVKAPPAVPLRVPAREKKLIFNILKRPHITEKASLIGDLRQYIFVVAPSANKNQIKKAVEGFYNVNVEKVRVINVPARPRRLGRTEGKKSGFKKAVVTLSPGEKIDIMPH